MSKRPTYSREFKLEAIRLLEHSGRPAAEIARELGIRRNQLYKWQEQLREHGDKAFPGKGKRGGHADELGHLKRENERLKEENEILKKAAAYFAKELK